MGVKNQPAEVGFSLSTMWVPEIETGSQAWQQALCTAEPSCWHRRDFTSVLSTAIGEALNSDT